MFQTRQTSDQSISRAESAADSVTSQTRRDNNPFRFNLHEFAGSLGDLGTFLPLVISMAIVCRIDLGMAFICAGALNIATGLLFRQPIPVQPMKALAAIAITEGLGLGPVVAAGLIMGVLLVGFSLAGVVDKISRWVPRPLVRGIQLCVGLKLVIEAVKMMRPLPVFGWDSWLLALLLLGAVTLLVQTRQPGLLYAFVLGFALLWWINPSAYSAVNLTAPRFHWLWPVGWDWWVGLERGALPQLPLTLLNSVVAVCALSADYFPGQGIAPRRMALSVGLMNLATVPLSGVPMCHGAGGLAAQYRFGARTGGSVIMLGTLKILVGLIFGSAILGLLAAYPRSILAMMLVIAGWSLGSIVRDARGAMHWSVILLTALCGIATNVAIGFLAGTALWSILHFMNLWQHHEEPFPQDDRSVGPRH